MVFPPKVSNMKEILCKKKIFMGGQTFLGKFVGEGDYSTSIIMRMM